MPPKNYNVSTFISNGSYGCVYRKPLECKEDSINMKYGNPNYMMKLMDKYSAEIELKYGRLLKSVDPLQQYFLYVLPHLCTVKQPLSSLKTDCTILKSMEDPKGYIMKYGGITLNEYIEDDRSDRINITLIWNWFNKMIKALVLLRIINMIHFDIKEDNLVIDENGDIFIIDFGLSTIGDHIPSHNTFYGVEPLFINMQHISNKKAYKDAKEQYHDQDFDNAYRLLHSVYVKGKKTYDKFISPFVKEIDVFSVGRVFSNIMDIFEHRFNRQDKKLTLLLRNIVEKMVLTDPTKQATLDQVTRYIESRTSELKLTELPITIARSREEKKRALKDLGEVKKVTIPEEDVIVYHDEKDNLYLCYTEDEIATIIPYYKINKTEGRSRFFDKLDRCITRVDRGDTERA